MCWKDTPRSILFSAAAASIALIHASLFGASSTATLGFGSTGALWILLIAIYAHGLAPGRGGRRRSRGLGAAIGVLLAGAAAWAMGASPWGALLACALALACVRSFWREPGSVAKSVLTEAAVLVGSLALSGWLTQAFASGPIALAAGVWGFFLVQSFAFVSPAAQTASRHVTDPFDSARRRLESLLDEEEHGR